MILHSQHCSPVSIRTREDEVREAGYAFLRERMTQGEIDEAVLAGRITPAVRAEQNKGYAGWLARKQQEEQK